MEVESAASTSSQQSEAETSSQSASASAAIEPADVMPTEVEHVFESTDSMQSEATSENQNESEIPSENPAESANVLTENHSKLDLGEWVGKSGITTEQKSVLLKNCWVPPASYDFSADSDDPNRKFLYAWLQTYAPWLVYSKKLKGALCLHCVLFHPNVVQGVLGAFIVRPFKKYKELHTACRNHATSQWHQSALKAAKSFVDAIPVDVQMITGHQKLIEENKKIIRSMIKNIIFCGTTDSPLRGKYADSGK